MNAREMAELIKTTRFRFGNEIELHQCLEGLFEAHGVPLKREVRLARSGRIDMAQGRVGIEVKIEGTTGDVREQLNRYAKTGRFDELLLVTTRSRHRDLHGLQLGDVPITVVVIPWM